MFKHKRLKDGTLEMTDPNNPKTSTVFKTRSEERRRIPTILQVGGYTWREIDSFMKEIK